MRAPLYRTLTGLDREGVFDATCGDLDILHGVKRSEVELVRWKEGVHDCKRACTIPLSFTLEFFGGSLATETSYRGIVDGRIGEVTID